ncbi:MAG: DUF4167 domain-containing protein [Rhodospirillales bacterium]|nr:DUF4167 domain-containing protein [Rhodospirillales bacterium]
MKPGSNRRPRSRPNNNNNSNNNSNKRQGGRNSYDSNGPDGKVRGTAQQVLEKYQALGRDATSAGDRIAAEAYFQFAEHYYRLVNADGGTQPSRSEQPTDDDSYQDDDSFGNSIAEPRPSVVAVEKEQPAAEKEQRAAEKEKRAAEKEQRATEKEQRAVEIVKVPIMPGPILPAVADEPSDQRAGQTNELDLAGTAPSAPEMDAAEKPKPVRRRRPRVKADAPEAPPVEPAQA